ncbi:hypothetical protein ABB37_02714 [Leptomonas pyrrhocoris]|uniref:Leucine-rich repeat protein n=1 Tax=Leptomonas pyrrhocoris TaxID=157538 RepID=A0A0N0DXH9_LEPPY|nr:hypothetical protein ABB37_02714 [Leptomonas pyrrhocoris]XP_015661411.1 hypothetical protein ABB37_02714 [Leptomonas pyrrhocoris]KPA82971.1 hypothetical protein ABB37_02714 [Leptomonas pyrrhocoris]KPA82972.1 hypothetical protein ABB37_02714 [Leptomonas pyrrhocoris]|eukprot:XP_015661410.1 hypothetical protein ABB37_02714 [Leptomonas pyrrhocoris]
MKRMDQNGVDAVTDYVVSFGVAAVIYTWCATHPQSYKAVMRSSARQKLAESGQDMYCLPDYDARSNTCSCCIRVEPGGFFLNDFRPPVPRWIAVWQARLICRLFGNTAEIRVVDLVTLSLAALLKEWDGTAVRVRSVTSKRRFTACVAQHQRVSGRLYDALSELQELQLLPSPFEDSSLAVVAHLPSLQRILADACRIEYLAPLRCLYHLQELQIAQTQIRDRELLILAELPLLMTLDISACSQLSSLDALSRSPSLRVLHAANCERLVRVSQLSSISTLRLLDLSENVLLPSEFGSLLTQRPLQLQTGYFMHLRWPREDPANVQRVLSAATHLHLSYCTLPNIHWLCGAHDLEQLYLNHSNVTAADVHQLAPHLPFLHVLSLSYCEHLKTNLDFVPSLLQLGILTLSRSSLSVSASELETFRRSLTVTLL